MLNNENTSCQSCAHWRQAFLSYLIFSFFFSFNNHFFFFFGSVVFARSLVHSVIIFLIGRDNWSSLNAIEILIKYTFNGKYAVIIIRINSYRIEWAGRSTGMREQERKILIEREREVNDATTLTNRLLFDGTHTQKRKIIKNSLNRTEKPHRYVNWRPIKTHSAITHLYCLSTKCRCRWILDSNKCEHFGIEEAHKASITKSRRKKRHVVRAMRWKCENNASIEDNEQFRLERRRKK